MKKYKGTILKVLLSLIIVVLLSFIVLLVYHHAALIVEKEHIAPPGSMVLVDGNGMHVYAEGEKNNKPPLIFMSDFYTIDPVYDFKVLYSKLSDEYRTVVIEKLGHGYSDVSGLSRDIETLVEENRKALKVAKEDGPYVLVPNSSGGLEAIYWALKYPDEISAIVGLDIFYPEQFQDFKIKEDNMDILSQIRFFGMLRLYHSKGQENLTDYDLKQRNYIINSKAFNEDIVNERNTLSENGKTIAQLGVPNVPMLLFTSNESNKSNLDEIIQKFLKASDKSQEVKLNCGSYVHYFESDNIAKKTKEFLKTIGFN